MHKSAIYYCLLFIQGKYIPVYLGDIKVNSLLYYTGAICIIHIIFLGFGRFLIQLLILAALTNKAIRGL